MDRQANTLIAHLLAAIETPADLTEEELRNLIEDAHIYLDTHTDREA